jgi:hypothetical protein
MGSMIHRLPYTGGAQRGAQLCFEYVGVGETKTQRAIAEERIILMRKLHAFELLVASDIQRAQRDGRSP